MWEQVKLLGVRETLWKCSEAWIDLRILKCMGMLLLPQQPGLRHLQGWGKEPHDHPGRQIGDAPIGFGENINMENKNSHPSSGPMLNTTTVGNVV